MLIDINGQNYYANVTGTTVSLDIEFLPAGEYEVTATYLGDENFTSSFDVKTFNVTKNPSEIKVFVQNVTWGHVAVINITGTADAYGNVTIKIGDKYYIAYISNGKGMAIISNLNVGNYTVDATYNGNYKYFPSQDSTKLEVSKINVTDGIVVVDQGNGTVVVVVGDNATGNVTIKVGDETFNATVINGTAVVTVDNVTPGTHEVEVIYSGDGNHTGKTITTDITAPKYETPIKISVKDVDVGDKAIITVIVPNGATGDVTIEIDGKTYSKQISGGKAVFEVEDLIHGNKSVFAEYAGDANYAANHTAGQFRVSKVASNINVAVTPANVGENVTVTVYAPKDATGQILIDIGGVGYYANITDGIATMEIPYLPEGVYDVNFTYVGDEKYMLSTNASLTVVSKLKSFVIPIASNIQVDDNENIVLIVPSDATGNVTVVIDGVEYDFNLDGALGAAYKEGEKYTVAVSGGKGELVISGLPKGEYTISVKYNGDKKYLPSTNSTIFTVSKQDSQIDIIDCGNGTIKVKLPSDVTGNVTVYDGNNTCTVEVINGTVTVDLINMTPGIHDIIVKYPGDNDHSSNKTTIIVEIPKYETPIDVMVSNIKVGERETVTVTVPENATGTVTIEINGREFTENVKNGKAIFNVDNLAFGDKTVAVKYSGDDYYRDDYTTGQFTVSKLPSTVKATSKNIVVGKDEVITATVPSDATGRVLVDIDGIGYYGNVVNGKAKIIIPELASGKYTAKVTYEGDDKYLPSTTTTTFTVSKSKAPISADADDIDEGEDATVVVKVPQDATGTISVTVDGKSYTKNVKDGCAVFTIPGLTRGDYDIGASYSGDRKYEANDYVTDIEVHFNETREHHGGVEVRAGFELSQYATGNPIYIILLVILSIGSTQIRRFKK